MALYLIAISKRSLSPELLLLQQQQQQQAVQAKLSPKTAAKNFAGGVAKADVPPVHKVAGLKCDKFGGPMKQSAEEMVYWRDIPSDATVESPFKRVGPEVKYLTFEPDEGGWNNIRMAMETAVTMALAMGRILVLPPEQGMYLLHKKDGGQKHLFTFKDFFHFDSVEIEHPNLEVIDFEEFLKREAMTGKLIDPATGKPSYPPNNRTKWDGKFLNYEAGKKGVFPWLRTVTKKVDWNWDQCLASFPAEAGPAAAQRLQDSLNKAQEEIKNIPAQSRIQSYTNKPTPVDAPVEKRIQELLATRKSLCIYDDSFQQARVVHLMGDNDSGARMLSHFYAFLFFEDWKHDQWIKRFVRDHLRYVDEIQCAAARYVEFLRMKARQFGNAKGEFYTMHVRRGDFQYKETRIEADQILANIRDIIPKGSVLYVASDEKSHTFFNDFGKDYKIYFLDSNPPLYQGLNSNFYGMLDQLIASKGKVFSGTFFSTFTGYINRLRGYHSQQDKTPGYEIGQLESYYHVPLGQKQAVKEYRSVHPPYWAREFPIGWRDIDKSVDGGSA